MSQFAAVVGGTSPAPSEDSATLEAQAASERLSARVDELFGSVRQEIEHQRRPSATYRVQFNRDFTFRQAADSCGYWNDLGISDVYASPYLKSAAGSMHGYDIVDHSVLNAEIGTFDEFESFVAGLRASGMGHILDFVPNHMGVGNDQNAWWQDVLENGPVSRYAGYFDIDWNPVKSDLECKVLLPVLGDQFGQVLESRQLSLSFEEGAFFIRYHNRRFPIAPKTYSSILRHRLEALTATLSADSPHLIEYQSIVTAIEHLPGRNETAPEKLEERYREKEVIKRRLQRLCEESTVICDWIRENVGIFNGCEGESRSFDLLDKLLMDQPYRLSFWRVAADEINYRRFFDVNELAALCMERPEVFESAHSLIFRLLEEGWLDGLRIDHADGLYDPVHYLWQLQERRFLQLCRVELEKSGRRNQSLVETDAEQSPADSWPDVQAALQAKYTALRDGDANDNLLRPLYLVVEKILERNERLPENWPVHGTTGYEFLNDLNGLFVAGENARSLDAVYTRFIGHKLEYSQIVYEAKLLIMRASMSSELHALGHQLDRISERNRWTRDFTLHGLILALREVIACFPVYRTYTVNSRVLDRDRRYVEQAVARAKRRNPAISGAVFDFVRDVLLFSERDKLSEDELRLRENFVGRFQQFTGPMMAKSVEDTAAYRYNRLVSQNEVGGDPERCGLSVAEFHQHNLERCSKQPYSLLATSTHDTKRSEDVRARINVLSEIPLEWKAVLSRWSRWNRRKKTRLDGELAPSRNDEYLLYQTLIGTWPFDSPQGADLTAYIERIQQYMTKAVREAKVVSSWIAPNEAYEQALHSFIEALLAADPLSAFRTEFEPFARKIAEQGMWNSLGQLVLKLTSPGVPDTYQGTEIWDFSLVDPDNRRPVDYAMRRERLARLRAIAGDTAASPALAKQLVESAPSGDIKLLVLANALRLRSRVPSLFTTGNYIPLQVEGSGQAHLIAFGRHTEDAAAIIVVPRLTAHLGERVGSPPLGPAAWGDTTLSFPLELARWRWRHVFTGEVLTPSRGSGVSVAEVLQVFPVAILESGGRSDAAE